MENLAYLCAHVVIFSFRFLRFLLCLWCGHHIQHGTMLGWDAKNNMLHGTSQHRKVWGNPTNAMWMPCWDGPSSPLQACAGCVVGMPRHQGINDANDWTNLHCTTPDFSPPKKSASGITTKSWEFRIRRTDTFLWSAPCQVQETTQLPGFCQKPSIKSLYSDW